MSEEKYVTLAEIRDLLTKENESRDLLTSQKAAMEHARSISPISLEQANELINELLAFEEVTENLAVKIADILPLHPEDLRAIFSKERVVLEADVTNGILEIVAKYL